MMAAHSMGAWRWAVLILVVWASIASAGHAAKAEEFSSRRETWETGWQAEQEADRIISLPGQPPVNFSMFSGYITVNAEAGRAHFYYFVEAVHKPEKRPLVIWFNGGPGCSSLAYGFGEELGPFLIKPGGQELYLNPHSGNKAANVLFVESPAGVGFAYSNTSSDLYNSGDNRTAYDNLAFVVNWLERFPQYKGRPLYLTGESYAGYYVPELAKLVFDRNKQLTKEKKINFKGFMVGNPVTDTYSDNVGYVDYIYYHAMISDETYALTKKTCNFSRSNSSVSNDCVNLLYYYAPIEFGNIDVYSIYAPACLADLTNSSTNASTASRSSPLKKQLLNPLLGWRKGKYDPCTGDYSTIYFNRPEVQKALHANTTGIPYPWVGCSDTLYMNWKDSAVTVLPIYKELLEAGLRLWVYSGDADSVVPVTGTRYALAALKLPVVVPWYPWYHKKQVGGRSLVYEHNLTFVTIRGAGHEVPLLRGAQFLQLWRSFLNRTLLTANPND